MSKLSRLSPEFNKVAVPPAGNERALCRGWLSRLSRLSTEFNKVTVPPAENESALWNEPGTGAGGAGLHQELVRHWHRENGQEIRTRRVVEGFDLTA